jgi:hypothetical protein
MKSKFQISKLKKLWGTSNNNQFVTPAQAGVQ